LEHRAEGLRNGVLRPCPFTALDVSIPYAEGFVGKKLSSTSNADGCVTDGMEVVVQLYDGQPFSAKVPARVTCSVIEAEPYFKGQTATPTCVWSIPFSPFFLFAFVLNTMNSLLKILKVGGGFVQQTESLQHLIQVQACCVGKWAASDGTTCSLLKFSISFCIVILNCICLLTSVVIKSGLRNIA